MTANRAAMDADAGPPATSVPTSSPTTVAGPADIEPQRLVIVLPSTGQFDSRTYRIASAAAARGHHVTVLARAGVGLPDREAHPAGYLVLRTRTRAVDGLPLPSAVRDLIQRGLDRRRRAPASGRAGPESHSRAQSGPVEAVVEVDTADRADRARPSAEARQPASSRLRRGAASVFRIFAIALTVRAQRMALEAQQIEADLIHAMAYMGIPVGLGLGRRLGVPVIYDARDIYVDANNLARLPRPIRRLLGRVERRWARSAAERITVNQGYADVMAERWTVPRPLIVMNCPYRFTVADPRERRFHEALGLASNQRVVLYQGGFSRGRGIEQLIEAISDIPNAHLVLLGYGALETELREVAANRPDVHVLPGVPPTELLSWVTAADVVAMPIQATTLNHRLTTPNKLLEAIAAGVPVVASDLPGMSGIVREVDAGILVDPTDRAAIARAIRDLLDEPEEDHRARVEREIRAAHETLNWESQMDSLLGLYTSLTGKAW